MVQIMQKSVRKKFLIFAIGIGLSVLGACEGFYIGTDVLVRHLPAGQDQVCRAAVRDALADKGVTDDWIRRTHYEALRGNNRVRGFQAWVFPVEGSGNLVVELNMNCRVTRIWARGTR